MTAVCAVVLRVAIAAAIGAKTTLWEERWSGVQASLAKLAPLTDQLAALRLDVVAHSSTASAELQGLKAFVQALEHRVASLESRSNEWA